MDSTTQDLSRVLIELGLIVLSLAILARIASRWGFSAIPLYLLAGLAFGKGGLGATEPQCRLHPQRRRNRRAFASLHVRPDTQEPSGC